MQPGFFNELLFQTFLKTLAKLKPSSGGAPKMRPVLYSYG